MIIFFLVFIWSAIDPKDYFIWFLEVFPAMAGFLILAATYNSFRLTPLLYFLILVHCIGLMIGGHYTYADVPLFEGLWGAERNNYDKVGHFLQGFVPAIIAREVLVRKKAVNGRAWLNLFIITICLAFSAFYEMLEWWIAVASGDEGVVFLATQGYEWDTQSDMAWALFGASIALMTLAKTHDKQLENVK